MPEMTKGYPKEIEELCERRKTEILSAKDNIEIKGTVYYVSIDGNDENDGKSPEHPWKSMKKVSDAQLLCGDAVLFRRGDLFRGFILAKSGVTYAAYGEGEKPKIYAGPADLSFSDSWELFDRENNIWKYKNEITDCGTLVFNDGEAHSRKLIPSYRCGKFVCRNDESKEFVMADEMTCDLDIFCRYDSRLTDAPSKGEDFPVPIIDDECYGELYLRCDRGNPAMVFDSVEAIPWSTVFRVLEKDNVTIDNICVKYAKFAVAAGSGGVSRGLHVSNCEMGWIGGNILNYLGLDPNYPEGRRGSVTRYGNAVEIYGGCDGYTVENCYIYQCYDAGITHQISTFGKKYELKNVLYKGNLVEDCVYSIEYFLEKNDGDVESYMENIEMCDNILRRSGYGWGQQRHNIHTPAHIKGWSYENTARNFVIHNNVFDRAAYRMLHLVCKDKESLPQMYENTYIQRVGQTLGQYGQNRDCEPPNLSFDENAESVIKNAFCDRDARIYKI